MADFAPLVVRCHSVTHWKASIDWALARTGEKSDQSSIRDKRYSTKGLLGLYEDIYQTIDGTLTAYDGNRTIVRFKAVDSSYWEIDSEDDERLEVLGEKFGWYQV